MIVIRFGTWRHAGEGQFFYWRIYVKGKWTPFCRIGWRYKDHALNSVKGLIFATYENQIMGTRLGRFRIPRLISNKLYSVLIISNLKKE